MIFLPNYTPSGISRRHRPAAMDPPGDVPLATFQAAQRAGATHLSADGLRAYTTRYSGILEAEWQGGDFGSWWIVDELPADAVQLED